MDIFKEISDMNFKEAYKELASIAYEEATQFVSSKKEALLEQSPGDMIASTERELRDRLPFG
jgi:hypothetical protein